MTSMPATCHLGCGAITVTFTAEDECDNTATTTSTITIDDDTDPVFAAITPLMSTALPVHERSDYCLDRCVTATDNCGDVTITNDFNAGSLPLRLRYYHRYIHR